jgi:hypothetical protein
MGELETSFFKDLYKVYTNVQHEIIISVIKPHINQLGFADIWITWVMVCVKSVSKWISDLQDIYGRGPLIPVSFPFYT